MIYNNILDLIGNTPLVKYSDNIFLKLEYINPSGSIKARAAYSMINEAIKRGDIDKNTVIIEPTSGNTGIALAMVCAVLELKLIICMPENMSEERKKSISAYGAELVLTSASDGMQGAVNKAYELKEFYKNSWIPNQFSNLDNARAHKATANEIIKDTKNNVDIVIAGIGTGGTAFGLKKFLPNEVKVFGVEPEESPLFTEGKSGPHKIQGIGANFVPDILDTSLYDEVIAITDEEAMETGKKVARKEGFLVGISSGAALAAAKVVASREENRGKNIVVLLPDTGDRYLSTPMFSE